MKLVLLFLFSIFVSSIVFAQPSSPFLICGDNSTNGLTLYQEGSLIYGSLFYQRSNGNISCDPYTSATRESLACVGYWTFSGNEVVKVELKWPDDSKATASFQPSSLYANIPVILHCVGPHSK